MFDILDGTVLPGKGTPVQSPDQLKRLATARARAALRGLVVHAMPDDAGRHEFIVTQGAWTASLRTICDLERWLDRIEGRRA